MECDVNNRKIYCYLANCNSKGKKKNHVFLFSCVTKNNLFYAERKTCEMILVKTSGTFHKGFKNLTQIKTLCLMCT